MMPDQLATWLSLVTAPGVSAVAAWTALIVSILTLRANRHAFLGKLLSDLLDEYATEKMREAMVVISEHQDEPGKPAPTEPQRRMVSHYFQKLYTLWKAGTISEPFAKQTISKGQAVRFLGLERIERSINPNYDRGPFKFYAKLHGLPRTQP